MTISFPSLPDSNETQGVKVYTVYTDSVVYQIGMDTKELKVKGRQEFESGLKGFQSGYSKKLAGYSIHSSDTTIGGVEGAFMFAVSRDTSAKAIQFFQFYTIISNHLYFIQCSTPVNKPAITAINRFFDSVQFKGENYPSEDATYSVAFIFGQMVGYVLIIGFVFWLIRLAIRWIKRARN